MASRGCIILPNLFCYVCGYLTNKAHQKTFTPFLRRAYELYFDSKVFDMDMIMDFHTKLVHLEVFRYSLRFNANST